MVSDHVCHENLCSISFLAPSLLTQQKEEKSEVESPQESKNNAAEKLCLANTKEKTPMCLINELARFNKVCYCQFFFFLGLNLSVVSFQVVQFLNFFFFCFMLSDENGSKLWVLDVKKVPFQWMLVEFLFIGIKGVFNHYRGLQWIFSLCVSFF